MYSLIPIQINVQICLIFFYAINCFQKYESFMTPSIGFLKKEAIFCCQISTTALDKLLNWVIIKNSN